MRSFSPNLFVRKAYRGAALLLALSLVVPVHSFAGESDSNVVDYLYQARRDPNVVDNFVPMETRIREAMGEEEARAHQERQRAALKGMEDGIFSAGSPSIDPAALLESLPLEDMAAALEEEIGSPVEIVGKSEVAYAYPDEPPTSIPWHSRPLPLLSSLVAPLAAGLSFGNVPEPSVRVINPEAHPKMGDIWDVRFETSGTADLIIIPHDQATVEDDEFLELRCGAEKREPSVGEGDVIVYKDWHCVDIATLSHMTLKEGKHVLRFHFGSDFDIAYNGPNSKNVLGTFMPRPTATANTNATLNIRQPDPREGDLMIAFVALRPSGNTVTTPGGWTSLGSWTGTDGGAEGADTGSVRLYWFYKVADGTEGITNVGFAETGTTSVIAGQIINMRSATKTYDIIAEGYSLNGDTVTWGTNLSTSFEMRSGDAVFLAAAQNGNLSNTSGWNITATGVASKSTVLEVGEFTTTSGNDLEIGVAHTLIYSGTSVAAPATTITQSAAASGAVAALRVRQGAGANRSDTFVRSSGLRGTGTTSVAPSYPDHEIGDIFILLVGNRPSTVTPTTPTNWTLLANSYTGGVGAEGIDTGTTRTSAYYRVATSLLTNTTQSVTVTSGNASVGVIYAVHRDGATAWTTDVDGGGDSSAGTGWSVTGSGIDLSGDDGGDSVIVGSTMNTDAYTYSAHDLSASGITFSEVNEDGYWQSTSGNDISLQYSTAKVSAGTGSGAPTYTMTASGSTASAPAGSSVIVAAHGVMPTFTGRTVRLISAKTILNQGARLKVQ